MNRGIRFCIPNEWGNFLSQIFDSFPLEKYVWRICKSEVYRNKIDSHEIESYIEEGILTGQELREIINAPISYYVVFLRLFAYSISKSPCPEKLEHLGTEKYIDFLESDCQLGVYIGDCSYVSIYAKDSDHYNKFIAAYKKYGFIDLVTISEENDFYL